MSELTAEQAHLFVHNVVLGTLKNESRTTRSFSLLFPRAASITGLTHAPKPPTSFFATSPVPITSF